MSYLLSDEFSKRYDSFTGFIKKYGNSFSLYGSVLDFREFLGAICMKKIPKLNGMYAKNYCLLTPPPVYRLHGWAFTTTAS